jgi:hypothetical protein
MTDRPAEPRGLTLADLMVLIAGVAVALALPDEATRPDNVVGLNRVAEWVLVWLKYLNEQLSKLCLAPGFAALCRCARYRRPIRSPEFLALTVGWLMLFRVVTNPPNGWITFSLPIHVSPTMGNYQVDERGYGLWYLGWFLAGCVAAVCLAMGTIRRRLSAWMPPILLLLTWAAVVRHLSGTLMWHARPRLASWAFVSIDKWIYFATILPQQLPTAAALAGLTVSRFRAGWVLISWLALALALAALVCEPAAELLGIFVVKNFHFSTPESLWQYLLQGYALPALVLVLETGLLLLWFSRRNRLVALPSPSSSHPTPFSPPHE